MNKNFLFLILIVGISLLFVACNKNNGDIGPIGSVDNSSNIVSTYCNEIDDWVTTNFPNETIDSVILVTQFFQGQNIDVYKAYLSNDAVITFNVDSIFNLPECSVIGCECSTIYDPVCWNDINFDNECAAICAGAIYLDIIPGICDPCANCSNIYDPVCANGMTYDNECLAICNGVDPNDIYPGPCGDCGCPTNYDPVCGNGVDYDNNCLAICDGVDQTDIIPGTCSTGPNCNVLGIFPSATVVSITEGYVNVNYGNAYYAIVLDFDGAEITVYFTETCDYYTICGCDPTLDIVCKNGTNFINTCHAECNNNLPGPIVPGPC